MNVRKKAFTDFEDDEIRVFWKETVPNSEEDLLQVLCVGVCERMFNIEKRLFDELYQFEKDNGNGDFKEWLKKLVTPI